MQFENYLIRLPLKEDIDSYYHLIESNRKRLEAFFAGIVVRTQTFADMKTYFADVLQKIEAKTYFPFLIIDTSNQKIIGLVDLKNIDWNIPKGELGCFMDEKYMDKKVAGKALALVVEHIFKEFDFQKIFLRTHKDNAAARKLAENCGFEIEGTIRKDYKNAKGELVDLIYYGKLRDYLS